MSTAILESPASDKLTSDLDDVLLYLYDLRNVPQPDVSDEKLAATLKMVRQQLTDVAEIVGSVERDDD